MAKLGDICFDLPDGREALSRLGFKPKTVDHWQTRGPLVWVPARYRDRDCYVAGVIPALGIPPSWKGRKLVEAGYYLVRTNPRKFAVDPKYQIPLRVRDFHPRLPGDRADLTFAMESGLTRRTDLPATLEQWTTQGRSPEVSR